MAPEQAAVQPDIPHQEGAFEADERALPMTRSRKAHPVPDGLVADRGAVQARHRHRRPGVVVEVRSGKAAVFAFPQCGNGHPPARVQLLAIQCLGRKQGQTIIQRHQVVLSGMTPSTERTR